MKRIEYIAPVQSMSGNLSGRQDIVYSVDGDKAYELGEGVFSAIGYQPRLIAQYRRADGRAYFIVRTKNTSNCSAVARRNWAVSGATFAIIGAIMRAKGTAIYTSIRNAYTSAGAAHTFRAWCTQIVRSAIAAGSEVITFAEGVTVNNPYVAATQTEGVEISAEIISKFSDIL